MSIGLNKITILGNVGKDPVIRSLADGRKIANFSVATTTQWKDRNTGEKKEDTVWHRVSVFSQGLIPVIERRISRGTRVYIEGAIYTNKWTDQSGKEVISQEIAVRNFSGTIIVLSGDAHDGAQSAARYTSEQNYNQPPGNHDPGALDDEIPF